MQQIADGNTTVKNTKRIDALDALRGIAILAMILSGSIPFKGALPAWMYHAQVPPPNHVFNPGLPGITWVDLVFPFFLFAMGAAIPFALSNKIEKGKPGWQLILQSFQRWMLLAVFAIYIQHIKPYAISGTPDSRVWLTSTFGFLLLFPMFMRFPDSLSKSIRAAIKIAGFAIGAVLVLLLTYNGKPFSVNRSDIIILVLSNVAFFGSVLWLYTRNNFLLRIAVFGFLIAFRLTATVEGSWNAWLWSFSPAPWFYKLYYLQYLFIVIPGTIAGDLIQKWIKEQEGNTIEMPVLVKQAYLLLTVILFCLLVITVSGLYIRALPLTLLADLALLFTGVFVIKFIEHPGKELYNRLFQWGVYWLLLGLCFEAFEGGIKKDHPTMSYYFVTSGLAYFSLILLSILIDQLQIKRGFRLIIANGKNPMVAYIAGGTLVLPILVLTGLNVWLNALVVNAWLGFLKGVLFTGIVAVLTAFCTRMRWFLRT